MNRLQMLLLLLIASFFLSACAHVKTWERGVLMSRVMEDGPSGLESRIENHVHSVREGMTGATPGKGTPCGCN